MIYNNQFGKRLSFAVKGKGKGNVSR